MIMSGRIAHIEMHGYFRIETFLPVEVLASREIETIGGPLQSFAVAKEFGNASILAGDAAAGFDPSAFQRPALQDHAHSARGQSLGCIQNVRADSAHDVSSFSKRKQVILF